MIVLTSTAGGWRTVQINYSASWLKVSKVAFGAQDGRLLQTASVLMCS